MDPNVRMQKAVEGLLSELEMSGLRPMRRDAFLCSAKCCESKTSSPEQLQQCVQTCQAKVGRSEQVISHELEQFQQRLQRCAMACNDKAQDMLPSDPAQQTPELIGKLQAQVEACANKCVDTHISSLGKMKDRINGQMKQM
mmetsp:Transcript_6464/g.10185  ORF Transcript_6464/g.10185 Transcript_6464/m.10185 type:complete len:141 (+) Transcript_6464:476-898(+)|eukprot:CAMPEP_0203745636 /NCGR_PEP_ID=MMETSP0098-20131031/1312_1 /ASSEMBLY_ACC=CAM_ASM_000208 /TAXON_ID=96639 /ORGANISM=" , Strain NY0313808BC1" /LENGTH=140 /DNA_ID=CAMNT_0050633473 /DNA_START=425 /DNA_END=847 /DNA_ORIENTATION=+